MSPAPRRSRKPLAAVPDEPAEVVDAEVVLDQSEARSTLNRVLDEELPEGELRAIIRTLRDKAKDGDLQAGRLLEKYMSQGKGTPKQTTSIEMTVKAQQARTIADIQALSDEELAALAAGAVTRALPAAGGS